MAATVQASRFALLTVDDDVDSGGEDTKSKASGNKAAQQASSAKKKKNKKKKAEQQKAENDELRSLAFGKGGKGKSGGKPHGHGSGDPPQQQWEQWKQRDNTFASETYEQDLQQALLLSKLEFEEHKEVRQAIGELNGQASHGGKEKKKKKKDKPAAMSLEQFNQMVDKEQGSAAPEDEEEWTLADESPSPKVVIPVQESDPKFFRRVEEDVTKILQKEKIQEEYRKQYVVESARSQQYQAAIEKRDKEITMLRASSEKMQEELNQVKKRNQQLCHILAQGEMKDKRSVLVELEELQQVRDELTQTVGELTTELEKERSKVHALKAELDKVKPNQGGRSGGKN